MGSLYEGSYYLGYYIWVPYFGKLPNSTYYFGPFGAPAQGRVRVLAKEPRRHEYVLHMSEKCISTATYLLYINIL